MIINTDDLVIVDDEFGQLSFPKDIVANIILKIENGMGLGIYENLLVLSILREYEQERSTENN